MERTHPRDIHSTGVRAAVKAARDAAAMDTTTTTSASNSLLRRSVRIARSLLSSRACVSSQSIDTCEKPAQSTNTVLGLLIAAGVVVFLLVLGILYFLHLRRKRHDKAELENDPHELSDYGLDEAPAAKKGGKDSNNLAAPDMQAHRLSAQQLMEAQNPFGYGAELADADRVSNHKGSPPRYPGDAHVKM